MDIQQTERKPTEPKTISLDGWLQPTTLHFQVVDGHRGHDNSVFIYLLDPSKPVRELMKMLSMWGGPSRQHEDFPDALGYEVHKDQLPAVLTIIDRTASNRPKDDVEALVILQNFCVEHPAKPFMRNVYAQRIHEEDSSQSGRQEG